MTIYLGNISYETTEAEIFALLETFGTISDINYPTDRITGNHRGFAFVSVHDPESAATMLSKLEGAELNGRLLRASEAKAETSSSTTKKTMPVGFRRSGEPPFGGPGGGYRR